MYRRVSVIAVHPDWLYGVSVLLARVERGPLLLPGGGAALGETLEEAAHRTLLEQTGLTAEEMRPQFALGGPHTSHHIFEAEGVQGIDRPLGETVELVWFPVGGPRAGVHASVLEVVDRWAQAQGRERLAAVRRLAGAPRSIGRRRTEGEWE